jgi:hypothetical protein
VIKLLIRPAAGDGCNDAVSLAEEVTAYWYRWTVTSRCDDGHVW